MGFFLKDQRQGFIPCFADVFSSVEMDRYNSEKSNGTLEREHVSSALSNVCVALFVSICSTQMDVKILIGLSIQCLD